ncbi:GNAT family N-acetyltransferase [Novosphingobium sp. PC22D]|uniref:GNAT family N-acetyltransferase n=1 Tax=Novosphingobium sp. PC22D TaxID=1962403 RepID=UPI000BF184DD|nr:GNAT family N-acetyltransferase [Novosphingobium sp. PC22D]PEQ13263.1 GNAT family N-acetyltransferase [Novosphingobium sp. PC22D]
MATVSAPVQLATRSGIELQIRPATDFDELQLIRFFKQVSEDDRRFRFLEAADHLGHAQVEPLVHVDHLRSESFLAFETGEGKLVATGQLVCDEKFETAEVAVSVRADFRGKGVGWAMLEKLADEAHRRGVRRVISIEDRANTAAIALEQECGFVAEPLALDPALVMLTKSFEQPA